MRVAYRRPGRPGESARWRCRPPPDRIIPPKRLRGLDDLVGLQTARADVDATGAPAIVDPHLLQVGVETAPGGDHRVAPGVPERGPLAAAVTDLGHCDG